ncbi:SGNH/GDSL hydrolase family protein [Streptomyces sp. enrichment culture]|uniref:SGNH/GDSL hydrolase family protein n=1 Tax=Streptomyces sp. enrichment culture TaxID=1795815 RepID=UPI003F56E22C
MSAKAAPRNVSAQTSTASQAVAGQGSAGRAVARPLDHLFDNTAVSDDARPAEADFDGSGASLSAQALATAGWTPGRALTIQGARLTWPHRAPGEPDNVVAAGQSVRVTGRGNALAFLVAGTGPAAGGRGTITYADGTVSAYRLTAPDWRTGPLATKAVALPYLNTPGGRLAEKARLYVVTVPLAPSRAVLSVQLPHAADLHVFALTVRPATRGWTGTWAAATSGHPAVGPWADRTLRLVVHTSAGGPRLRLRFDNTFASVPVGIESATVAVQARGAAAVDTPVPVTFRAAAGVSIPAGAQAYSDPLDFPVPADTNLLVSFRLTGTVSALPVHRFANQRSYVSRPGDHTTDPSATAFTGGISYWPLLAGVDVGGGPGSVVLLGDSITDGSRSTVDANRRWPDLLFDRLQAQSEVPHYGMVNQGISANRVVTDGYPGDGTSSVQTGVSALNRLDRDVFAQTSARSVVVFEGVNDLRFGADAEQVAAGLREIAQRARARGLKVFAATILPCGGNVLCTPAMEAERAELNAWLRKGGGGFDGLFDFDAALRDPADPTRMLPAYDGGDGLHPNDAGMAAMAQTVDLEAL